MTELHIQGKGGHSEHRIRFQEKEGRIVLSQLKKVPITVSEEYKGDRKAGLVNGFAADMRMG